MTPLYPQKLALTSPTGGGRSVGIVRSRAKATEFSFNVYWSTAAVDGIGTPENFAVNPAYFCYHTVFYRGWVCKCKRKLLFRMSIFWLGEGWVLVPTFLKNHHSM